MHLSLTYLVLYEDVAAVGSDKYSAKPAA
jgi:hypothetical protein